MSFKRVAGTELNHDNWNEEYEGEEAGEFKKASDDILQKRARKVAKRRIAGDSDDSTPSVNPFSGFGGFNNKQNAIASSTPSSPFSFLSKLPAAPINTTNKTNGEVTPKISSTTSPAKNDTNNNDNTEYYSKVKSLNTAFADWIKSNIEETKGLCDFTPVFKDYEKYMKECLELKNANAKKTQEPASKPAVVPEEKKEVAPTFTFGKPAAAPAATNIKSSPSSGIFSSFSKTADTTKEASPVKPAESKPFSFGITPTNSITGNLSATPSFSFGLQKTSTAINSAPPPIFGSLTSTSSTPFTFGNVTQNTNSTTAAPNEEEADEEPPKNEFVPVVEEDSLYSKRCKVFVKSGADYADRGIGTLFLKKVDDKVQLIVRADTNLGNILLNIIICDGLPTSRLGKNNVMIVCLPTPESKPPPIPVLVRVKTADEADELLATLEKYKK